MPRPKSAVPKHLLKAMIPQELRARLDLLLYSELEARVPLGRYSEFITERLQEYFSWETLDLGLYGFGQGYYVRGPKAMIEALKEKLNAISRPAG